MSHGVYSHRADCPCISCVRHRTPVLERFWCKVTKTDSCWLWTGAQSEGYGTFRWAGRVRKAHIVSWFIAHGTWPGRRLEVCHTCDVRNCVRPEHLFLGTTKENKADAVRKGRHSFGVTRPGAILDPDKVREIRRLVAGGALHRVVARRFGISEKTVSNVIHRHWKSVA